jgi:hypothetical protein
MPAAVPTAPPRPAPPAPPPRRVLVVDAAGVLIAIVSTRAAVRAIAEARQ